MDLKRLSGRAKQLIDKRGGVESLKQDAAELKDIAKGPGSAADKAKAAAKAVKQPGRQEAEHGAASEPSVSTPPPSTPPPAPPTA